MTVSLSVVGNERFSISLKTGKIFVPSSELHMVIWASPAMMIIVTLVK